MKKSTKTLLICIVAFLALAVLGELELRALGAYGTWEENNKGSYISPYTVQHNTWLLLRPANTEIKYTQPEFDFSLKTNSLGIRDIEHQPEKPAGTFRILVLGDSLVEGQGAPFMAAWPKILENQLNTVKDKQVEVILGGVAGSDPIYCSRLFKNKLMQYSPDLVIMGMSSFDITDVVARGGEERFKPGDTVQYKTPPFWEVFFAKSRLVRFVAMRIFGYDWLLLSPEDQEKSQGIARKQILDEAIYLNKTGAENGFSLLCVMQPHLHELKQDKYSNGLDALADQLAGSGIMVCDILPCMKERLSSMGKPPETCFWEKDYHPNSLGYSLYAECVLDFLLKNPTP